MIKIVANDIWYMIYIYGKIEIVIYLHSMEVMIKASKSYYLLSLISHPFFSKMRFLVPEDVFHDFFIIDMHVETWLRIDLAIGNLGCGWFGIGRSCSERNCPATVLERANQQNVWHDMRHELDMCFPFSNIDEPWWTILTFRTCQIYW